MVSTNFPAIPRRIDLLKHLRSKSNYISEGNKEQQTNITILFSLYVEFILDLLMIIDS